MSVDEQAKRIYVARWLSRKAAQATGGTVPADASAASLEALAAGLRIRDLPLDGLAFEPPYPGRILVTPGARATRLLLTCHATLGAAPLGVVYTVLVPGRRPEVSVAPPEG